jgi:hypothetical protein
MAISIQGLILRRSLRKLAITNGSSIVGIDFLPKAVTYRPERNLTMEQFDNLVGILG